jgi:hypothetical protein
VPEKIPTNKKFEKDKASRWLDFIESQSGDPDIL